MGSAIQVSTCLALVTASAKSIGLKPKFAKSGLYYHSCYHSPLPDSSRHALGWSPSASVRHPMTPVQPLGTWVLDVGAPLLAPQQKKSHFCISFIEIVQ